MQFHLNGFVPGDPEIFDPAERHPAPGAEGALPAEVDVLIVGCGPAGLTLAAQLAAFPDIKTCIVEQKDGPLLRGQADGIACRTMEMFEAFGFAERVLKEACWINETTFWKPDDNRPANIARSGYVQDVEDGLSEFPHVVMNQARVHDFYLDRMAKSAAKLKPHYARRLADLEIDKAPSNGNSDPYRVTARLERVDPAHQGESETVRARYVVGCDGARSTVRKTIGRTLHGDSANHAWGVMDVLAVTDFPDIRCKSLIQSARDGSVIIIPREGGYLFRVYVEMDKLAAGERVADRNVKLDDVIAAAQRVFAPYALDVKEVPWWSVYEIGQRLTDKFDDVDGDGAERPPCVFIAGDACHTHSPKAGQGMNVSMQDGFNLGWKLMSVLRKRSPPAPAAQLFGGAPGDRQGADRLRSRVGDGAQLVGAGGRPGRDASLFRPARPLYGRHRDALSPLAAHRRRHPSASRQGADHRHALSFGAGRAPCRRQADAARPYRQGRRPLAAVCVRAGGGPRRARRRHSQAVRISHASEGVAAPQIHPRGRGHRRGVRRARGFSAGPSRSGDRIDAVTAAAAERPLCLARLREAVLRRP